jgi:hypothetical protein
MMPVASAMARVQPVQPVQPVQQKQLKHGERLGFREGVSLAAIGLEAECTMLLAGKPE